MSESNLLVIKNMTKVMECDAWGCTKWNQTLHMALMRPSAMLGEPVCQGTMATFNIFLLMVSRDPDGTFFSYQKMNSGLER